MLPTHVIDFHISLVNIFAFSFHCHSHFILFLTRLLMFDALWSIVIPSFIVLWPVSCFHC